MQQPISICILIIASSKCKSLLVLQWCYSTRKCIQRLLINLHCRSAPLLCFCTTYIPIHTFLSVIACRNFTNLYHLARTRRTAKSSRSWAKTQHPWKISPWRFLNDVRHPCQSIIVAPEGVVKMRDGKAKQKGRQGRKSVEDKAQIKCARVSA